MFLVPPPKTADHVVFSVLLFHTRATELEREDKKATDDVVRAYDRTEGEIVLSVPRVRRRQPEKDVHEQQQSA